LRTEGFSKIQASNVMDTKSKDAVADDDKLQGMFKALKIQHRNSDPVHVEFIMQVQGRAVISHYFNETGITEMTDGLINKIGFQTSRYNF
jgi:hypothetical protein